ncbi:transcription termination factor MTERF2, chloroplastic isoform X1 [Sesamum indicum]|uniref:Transcription termination factor MTERF2, chloroplastic isoform X1 n=1 Tax=Sesamum indicum TaxID=4182 RepID=A0A6I9TRQ7_SESIN|nr:transcription termination factor MTERF2, chloroplastic isoform X1 [Sesamum indicum]
MLASQPQPQSHHLSPTFHLHHCRRFPPRPAILHIRSRRLHLSPISSSLHRTLPDQDNDGASITENNILRTHNSRSTALLLRHLSAQDQEDPHGQNIQGNLPLLKQDREKLLEISLRSKRTPQFPGSIYVDSSSPLAQSAFTGENSNLDQDEDDVDDEMLVQALEIRRKVTAEIFKEAMRKGKFGITYCENLVSRIPEFIDYVMIKAVAMKKLTEFSRSSYNVRARVFIDESEVVPLIRWLKHNSLSYPQIGKLICASRGNLYSIRGLAEWLKSIHVKGRFIGVALTRAGGNVLERSLQELDEIVEYLESNGVRRDWMGYLVSRCPEILSFSMEQLKSRAEFYLNMGMDKNDFGTMLFDCPKVLGYLSMEEMNQKVAYLKDFGLNNEDVGRLLAFKPQLMACSIEDRWRPLVKYFYYLGISRDGMRRILTMKPMVFCVDLENTIVPKVQFLRDIGVQEDAIGSVLARFPALLTYSLYKKIRPVVIFLLTKAGVSQQDIGKVIALGPELLGCSIANKLDRNVKYFLSLGITLPVLGRMISDFPMLLRYNVDVLRPKYRYLRRTMIRPLQDLIEFPRFFSYSLEERIIPRHKIMVENRINFKLRYMLASTDEEFDMRVKEAVERRRRFEFGVTYEPPSDSQNDDSTKTSSFSQMPDIAVEST